jgi:phosphoserine aminotransferase
LKWLKRQGGVEAIEKLNNKKAALLYQTIDSLDFVYGTAVEESRSKMNATFYFEKPDMNKIFDDLCLEANIVNIKGHRTVGGYRASLYNALPLESVKVLTDVLNQMKLIV